MALPKTKNVRLKILRPRVPARPGADRVRLVNDEQRSVLAREFPQRLVISRLRMHDAHVRHRWLGQHASYVARDERGFQSVHIVELDHLRRDRRIHRRPNVPRPRPCHPIRPKSNERLIYRAVIAPVEN